MPDLIRHPLPVDSGTGLRRRAGVTEAPRPGNDEVMPDLIRHPLRLDSGARAGVTGSRRTAAVMPDLIRHPLPVDSGSRAGVTRRLPSCRT
jgi:hypothetical protein